jgi:serine/threonine-protein kinase
MSHGTSHAEHELSPGDVCDGYRIVSLLAAGGMGDVYEAVHDATRRTVAVKCLKVRHRNKEDARARMKMEAVVLSELQHENLVQVFDAGVTDAGMVWYAMERLHGRTLRDVLFRAGRLPIPDALHYASEIADGVDAVHEVNVIHRDLKPENVFVTDDNVIKVLDLGTGKFTGYGLNSTDRMRVVGTTAYMSPEQIKGLRVDARADVYALGLIVYEMIAGRHALAPEGEAALPHGVEQVALMQLQMTPKPLADVAPGCPVYVSAIVDRAIAKDRDERFPNIAALARELRAARKRFVAENQLDAGGPVAGEGLREKFGAPPRTTPLPRGPVLAPPRPTSASAHSAASSAPCATSSDFCAPAVPSAHAGFPNTMAGLGPGEANAFATEVRAPVDITLDGSTPAPGYVPTVLLSSSSVPGLPADFAGPGDATDRGLPPDEVRNRTTQTNPIGFVRAAEEHQDDSIEIDFGGGSWLAFWRHPFVRRAAVTLGLGAVIGVPPAVLGVLWARYYRAPGSSTPSVVQPLPAAPNARVAPTEPRGVTTASPATGAPDTRATQGGGSSLGTSAAAAPAPLATASNSLPSRTPTGGPATRAAAQDAPGRSPRARPKAQASPVASPFVEDPDRPSKAKVPVPVPTSEAPDKTVSTDPAERTILPPSGL